MVTVINTMAPFGAAFGSFGAGPLSKYGRWNTLVYTNVGVVIGCGLTLIQNVPAICIGRLIWGFTAGAYSVFVPKFINETAPIELKGSFGALTQFYVTFGIMISFILGLATP